MGLDIELGSLHWPAVGTLPCVEEATSLDIRGVARNEPPAIASASALRPPVSNQKKTMMIDRPQVFE
jgi:hypothetical protein